VPSEPRFIDALAFSTRQPPRRRQLRAAGRKAPINDSWIAATAIAHHVPVVTQDSDYGDMPGVEVIRI
jgi:predicted nucleic acid-binding protein